jgi:hypothetical protein
MSTDSGPAHSGLATIDSHTMKKYGLPFLLISGALIATDHKTADLLPNTENQTKWRGRVSQLGAAYSLAGFSGATYLIGKATKDEHKKEAGILGLEALAHTQVLVLGLKAITQRERPLDENPSGTGFWKGGDAFPSGHSASSFAVATVFAYEYRRFRDRLYHQLARGIDHRDRNRFFVNVHTDVLRAIHMPRSFL